MLCLIIACILCGSIVFTACANESNEEKTTESAEVTQTDIEEKIIGNWILADKDGKPQPTNKKYVIDLKITGFNPLILTKDAEAVIAVFEALGFEKRHEKTGVDFSSSRMKDANGFHVDVTEAAVPQDVTTIRMNVSSFEEAYQILSNHGFKGVSDEKARDTGSSRSAMMISPSGFSITIVEHIKKVENA